MDTLLTGTVELRMPASLCYVAAIPTTAPQTRFQYALAGCRLQKATTATAFRKSSAGIPAQVLSEVGRRGSPRGPAPVESSVRAALARGSADPASPTAPHGTTGRLAEMPERSSDVESALRSS